MTLGTALFLLFAIEIHIVPMELPLEHTWELLHDVSSYSDGAYGCMPAMTMIFKIENLAADYGGL